MVGRSYRDGILVGEAKVNAKSSGVVTLSKLSDTLIDTEPLQFSRARSTSRSGSGRNGGRLCGDGRSSCPGRRLHRRQGSRRSRRSSRRTSTALINYTLTIPLAPTLTNIPLDTSRLTRPGTTTTLSISGDFRQGISRKDREKKDRKLHGWIFVTINVRNKRKGMNEVKRERSVGERRKECKWLRTEGKNV